MGLKPLKGRYLRTAITSCTGTGFLLFGYDQGVFGALIKNPNFQETFDHPSPMVIGQITATYDLGCFFGAILAMAYGDQVGRRLAILLGCLILVIGAVLQTAAYSVPQMIIGRFVAGLGNGINTTTIPVWQTETSQPRHRGLLMVLQLALNQLGNVTAQWLNFGLGYIPTQAVSWRFPIAFQIFYALATVALLPWLPDSPRWLIQRGRNDEARSVIARLHARPVSSSEVEELFNTIVASTEHELELSKASWLSLFRVRKDRLQTLKRVVLGAGTQFMQQWSGINVITYYLPIVFASLGLSRRLSLALSGCNAVNLMVSTCLGSLFIESVGRKKLMVWGALSQGICFALVAGGLGAGTTQWSIVAAAFVFAYYTTFGLTWIAVPWMYPAEVNTQQWRNRGAGIATATNWICNYAVVLVTPVGLDSIGWRYYILYAVLNLVFVPVVHAFYVETARLSLEQIDAFFEERYERAQNHCVVSTT
ncbi:general substrate transporter [Aspergillus karnatakaensis]|uniref:sugar porter family MFS transporter n=1 Tax=Aspergillus karnatakaensis TaxID=1810916 RepID=UPI003CCDA5B2